MILERLGKILEEYHWSSRKILVAVSGGSDSMALAAALNRLGVTIALAHCNFGLRAGESDGDEQMIREWADEQGIPCHVQRFNTRGHLEEQGGNLQETARNLRYTWFEELRTATGFDLVATAHHREDSVETMLFNFFKGTGIAGLHGILPRQRTLIRPFLFFSKEAIRQFAADNHIPWREDSSNAKDDYTRNAIRHQLLPAVTQLFPQAADALAGNTIRLREAEMLYNESLERYRKKLLEQRNQDWYIPVLKLQAVQPLGTILWELVKPFGFSAAQAREAQQLLHAATGKYVASATHRIIRNRNFLIITPVAPGESTHLLLEAADRQVTAGAFVLTQEPAPFDPADMEKIKTLTKDTICLDLDKLVFPLVLRPRKTGDYFYPLGMNRKKKKVSRFLIEQKVPLHEKENVWVLESDKKIVWVVGMRPDDRFRITEQTHSCCYFSVKER